MGAHTGTYMDACRETYVNIPLHTHLGACMGAVVQTYGGVGAISGNTSKDSAKSSVEQGIPNAKAQAQVTCALRIMGKRNDSVELETCPERRVSQRQCCQMHVESTLERTRREPLS